VVANDTRREPERHAADQERARETFVGTEDTFGDGDVMYIYTSDVVEGDLVDIDEAKLVVADIGIDLGTTSCRNAIWEELKLARGTILLKYYCLLPKRQVSNRDVLTRSSSSWA
jgi:hypothetical protein